MQDAWGRRYDFELHEEFLHLDTWHNWYYCVSHWPYTLGTVHFNYQSILCSE